MAGGGETEKGPDWFDELYGRAGRDSGAVPWARMAPHPFVAAWLGRRGPGWEAPALVIASGLGDDAEEAARHGYRVTAFDASPAALDWCRERFPGSVVDYRVADLFDLPRGWRRAFDLVVEVYTVQSVGLERRRQVMDIIAGLVAPGGTLLVAALARPDEQRPSGPPFPVSRRELAWFELAGLDEVELTQDGWEYLAEYKRR